MASTDTGSDAVVVGAGVVGACCALYLARAGLSVCVVDRGAPATGTTGAGEGNILVSDKVPGPELSLARRSIVLWRELAEQLAEPFEFETKGGLVVTHGDGQLAALNVLADGQRGAGVAAEPVDGRGLRELEPHLSRAVAGGMFYPEDAQVQPMLACWGILRAAEGLGASLVSYTEVQRLDRDRSGAVAGVVTDRGVLAAPVVVNAAGPWSGELAVGWGTAVPVAPRRGQVLVTEPLGDVVHHKVYDGDYVGTVTSDDRAGLCSAVVEGTVSGTVLIGSSREFVAFDRTPNLPMLGEMARRALRLFPFLAGVRTLRTYLGFRPSTPDHLPIIGADPTVSGLYHATGHEGAGIGLAPATGELLAGLVTGTPSGPVDPSSFALSRFHIPAGRSSQEVPDV